MEDERRHDPEFLKSIISVRVSSRNSLSDVKRSLSRRSRVIFIGNQTMEFMIGIGPHTFLTTELGIEENKDLFMSGGAQLQVDQLHVYSNWRDFFSKMGFSNEDAEGLWEAIKVKITSVLES